MNMSPENPPSSPNTTKQSQAARAHTATPARQADYYDNEDLVDTESECETPSDRSQAARRASAPVNLTRAQIFRQHIANRDHLVYPPDLYVAPSEDYYGPQSGYRYMTPAAAPVEQMKKQRSNILSTQVPIPTRQVGRVCIAHARAHAPPAPVPIHHYYPQQYAIPQSSMVLHDDGMMMYGNGNDGMPPVPLVPLAQVSPQVTRAGGVMYHQQAQRYSAHHLQVPLPASNRFRSALHTSAANIRPPIPPRKTNSISVRTPRYIRRPCINSPLSKKPSTLCIPLACQPDPAVHRRYSKSIANIDPFQDDLQSKANKLQQQHPRQTKHPQDYQQHLQSASLTAELQPTLSQSQLDALFANYEELYLKATASSGYSPGRTQPKAKIMATMMGLGPPRVPKHIQKRRQEILRANKQQHNQLAEQADMLNVVQDRGDSKDSNASNVMSKPFAIPKDAETFDVQEITSQVLQELMCDMAAGNDTADVTMDNKMAMGEEIINDTDTTDCTRHDGLTVEPIAKQLIDLHGPKKIKDHLQLNETLPESFNYQDIVQNISKSKIAFHGEDEENNSIATQKQSTNTSRDHLKSDVCSTSDKIRRLASQKSLKSLKCSRVTNVAEAMELHRTKSYVVNLIDTALSNHFGTSVCDKYSSYECSGLNPVNLIETLKKHSLPKLEKDVCLEIAQALNQTYSNYNTGPDPTDHSVLDSNKPESCCSCKGESSEPTYIKYLRQLRWGHLKHIQAEAKRLEELERFFDSCSKKAFCEKYP